MIYSETKIFSGYGGMYQLTDKDGRHLAYTTEKFDFGNVEVRLSSQSMSTYIFGGTFKGGIIGSGAKIWGGTFLSGEFENAVYWGGVFNDPEKDWGGAKNGFCFCQYINGAEPPKIAYFGNKKIMPTTNDRGQLLMLFGVFPNTLDWWKSNIGRWEIERALCRKISQEEYQNIIEIMSEFSEYYLKNR